VDVGFAAAASRAWRAVAPRHRALLRGQACPAPHPHAVGEDEAATAVGAMTNAVGATARSTNRRRRGVDVGGGVAAGDAPGGGGKGSGGGQWRAAQDTGADAAGSPPAAEAAGVVGGECSVEVEAAAPAPPLRAKAVGAGDVPKPAAPPRGRPHHGRAVRQCADGRHAAWSAGVGWMQARPRASAGRATAHGWGGSSRVMVLPAEPPHEDFW